MRWLVVQARHHAHAARIVLEARVVESDGLWRLHGVRSHGSAPLGRASRAGGHTPDGYRRAPEAEPESVAAQRSHERILTGLSLGFRGSSGVCSCTATHPAYESPGCFQGVRGEDRGRSSMFDV